MTLAATCLQWLCSRRNVSSSSGGETVSGCSGRQSGEGRGFPTPGGSLPIGWHDIQPADATLAALLRMWEINFDSSFRSPEDPA